MDIDRIIDDVIESDFLQPKTKPNTENVQKSPADQTKISNLNINDLVLLDLKNEDIQLEIYNRLKSDIELLLDEYLLECKDPQKENGLYKCSLETWQAIVCDIGLNYFNKNKLLRDVQKTAVGGGQSFNDDLLTIGILLYENLCNKYRKQFFIYDCCKFLGMSLETMYRLNEIHSLMLKKAHSIQESSMRTALASGRSNVTAMAILLNHDYDYTRTTQVIHTSNNIEMSAEKLPELPADIRENDNLLSIDGL